MHQPKAPLEGSCHANGMTERCSSKGRCLHRPESAAGGSVRRQCSGVVGLFASGGGLFTAEKSPKRAGAAAPGPPWGPRHASPEEAMPRPLRSIGLSRPVLPAPSRLRAGQWNRMAITASELFPKAAPTAPEHGMDAAHSSFFAQSLDLYRRGAHCASVPRSGLSWRVW